MVFGLLLRGLGFWANGLGSRVWGLWCEVYGQEFKGLAISDFGLPDLRTGGFRA